MSARVLLVGGTSHAGKSTLAAGLAARLGCEVQSTDRLGRHPGRPWPRPRSHVTEFYRRLSPEAIDAFLLDHHGNMWPALRSLILARAAGGPALALEGSALRPEFVAEFRDDPRITAVWLTADGRIIRDRIERASGRAQLDEDARVLVDAFIGRSLRDNDRIVRAVAEHGLAAIDVEDDRGRADLLDAFAAGVSSGR